MLKCAVQVMRWRDTRAHRPAICMRNRCTHYVQFNELPLLAEASTILDRSLSHTYHKLSNSRKHLQNNGWCVTDDRRARGCCCVSISLQRPPHALTWALAVAGLQIAPNGLAAKTFSVICCEPENESALAKVFCWLGNWPEISTS